MTIKSVLVLILCIALCQTVGGLGAFLTYPEISGWYAELQKPSFNPPNWIFGPVWTMLYFLMGISLWLTLILKKSPQRKEALTAFTLQLLLNSLWSLLFFRLHSPLAALIDITALWLAIVFWMLKTYPLSKTAALLNIPYLLWVSFACILNFFIWRLNA